MKSIQTDIEGAYIVTPELKEDDRGYFTRIYCQRELSGIGVRFPIVQMNQSGSKYKGTVRGIHVQKGAHAEDKLIQCIKGAVFDVVVDVRKGSKTYGRWIGEVLSAENKTMMLVPKGCAHGYQTLENDSVVQYPVSAFYTPKSEWGIRWDDPYFRISWPIQQAIVSKKDASWADFEPEKS